MPDIDSVINDLNVAKLMVCNPQVLTPDMCVKIGQAISSAVALLKEHGNEYGNGYENGFNDAMLNKQELMYEGMDGKWYKKDW